LKVLGIIPARGGSKGIPGKNTRLLAGKPLVQYTAEAARDAKTLHRTLLTTDDAQIAEVGRQLGLWVPFLRPAELAQDDTPTLAVLLHVVEWLTAQGEAYDAYCLLQPTAPFRTAQQIDQATTLLAASDADSVISAVSVPKHFHPAWQMKLQLDGALTLWNDDPLSQIITRRQALAETFVRNGAIYVMRHTTLVKKKSLYGDKCLPFIMSSEEQVNLDTLDDWQKAEQLLARSTA